MRANDGERKHNTSGVFAAYMNTDDGRAAVPWQIEFMAGWQCPAGGTATVETYRRIRQALETVRVSDVMPAAMR